MAQLNTGPGFPTPDELTARLVYVEQGIRFLADANSLTRRLETFNEGFVYSDAIDLLFRLVDTLATIAGGQLRTISGSLTNDIPF